MGDPADGSLDMGTKDFSVSAWIKTSVNGEEMIVSKQVSTALFQMSVTDDSGQVGNIRATYGNSSGDLDNNYGHIRVDDDNWHHVVEVFDRDTGVTVYTDGIANFTAGTNTADERIFRSS